jgi:hypothetical protein
MNRLLAYLCEISVLVSTLYKPAIMGIFQALHGEVQHSSELFPTFCSLLSFALDGFSGSKKACTGIVLILLALAETIVRTDAAQLSSLVETGFLLLVYRAVEKLGRRR